MRDRVDQRREKMESLLGRTDTVTKLNNKLIENDTDYNSETCKTYQNILTVYCMVCVAAVAQVGGVGTERVIASRGVKPFRFSLRFTPFADHFWFTAFHVHI